MNEFTKKEIRKNNTIHSVLKKIKYVRNNLKTVTDTFVIKPIVLWGRKRLKHILENRKTFFVLR